VAGVAIDFEFDLTPLIHLIERTPEAAAKGAKKGLHDALDDWWRESVNTAPINKGALRASIHTKVEGEGFNLTGEINAVAVEVSKNYKKYYGRENKFNYAYYIHEVSEHAVTGDPKFLDNPAKKNEQKWRGWIEDEIQKELKKAGW
jgi:hypothetical protein